MTNTQLPVNATLEDAKKLLREEWEVGLHCPACTQWVQKYRYSFHSGMAQALIYIYQGSIKGMGNENDGFYHVERYFTEIKVPFRSYHGKMKYWNLIESMPNTDPKKHWSGYWKITQKGIDFVQGTSKVAKHAFLFNDKCYGFGEEELTIREALGKKFNYDELMKS